MFQSQWSLDAHRELGLELREPHVVTNAPDPAIFFPPASREPRDDRPLRLVTSSWSDNPRKGADALLWLDRHLAPDVEVTFVGRTQLRFERASHGAPRGSGRPRPRAPGR